MNTQDFKELASIIGTELGNDRVRENGAMVTKIANLLQEACPMFDRLAFFSGVYNSAGCGTIDNIVAHRRYDDEFEQIC